MSTNLTPPTLVMNSSGQRQQVPLRDYLNARVAPFLKKAMTESLASEAEFPLQWLGECLIHQSMLYEGNPDTTNIRERFRYNFEIPAAPPKEPTTTTATAPANGIEPSEQAAIDTATQAAADVPVPAPDSTMVNGEVQANTEAKDVTADAQETSNATAEADVDMAGTT